MSDKCGNCHCADRSQCAKKGDSYGAVVVDTQSRVEILEEVTVAEHDQGRIHGGAARAAAPPVRPPLECHPGSAPEHDGCKCGTNCSCGASCGCGK